MKYVHEVKVSVFCKEWEDEKKILEKLFWFFPFEIKKQFKRTTAEGFFDKPIKIFEVEITKTMQINTFLHSLFSKFDADQKDLLRKQIESRLDEYMHFFIRFDKDKLVQENKLWITDEGNCFHIKMTIAAFPKKREVAKKIVEEIIDFS